MTSTRTLKLSVLAVASTCCLMLTPAHATSLAGAVNVDNEFQLYLSTDDSVLGTLLLSGNNWPTTYSLPVTVLGAPTLYLHVVATDTGQPAAFIGNFSLSDSGYSFSNGTQALLTNTTNWVVRTGSFAGANETPVSRGFTGASPWGAVTQPSTAQWIWDSDLCGTCTRYFSTTITGAVPEPETYALMLMGLLSVGFVARRRRPE